MEREGWQGGSRGVNVGVSFHCLSVCRRVRVANLTVNASQPTPKKNAPALGYASETPAGFGCVGAIARAPANFLPCRRHPFIRPTAELVQDSRHLCDSAAHVCHT